MTMTIDRLKELCEGEDLKYFLAPDRPMVLVGFGGINGSYQVVIPIEVDGRFIQIRTTGYLKCPADHPSVNAVLAILGALNYKLRMIKFGWDPSDGEIVAYADVWIEDGDLTQKQFSRILKSLVPGIDLNFKRLSEAIETGKDPGEESPASVLAGDLPEEMRGLIDRLAKSKDDDEDDGTGFEVV